MTPDTRKNPYMVMIMRLVKSNMSTNVMAIAAADNIILTIPSHGADPAEHPVHAPVSGVGGNLASSSWWALAYFCHLARSIQHHLVDSRRKKTAGTKYVMMCSSDIVEYSDTEWVTSAQVMHLAGRTVPCSGEDIVQLLWALLLLSCGASSGCTYAGLKKISTISYLNIHFIW